jgi:DNA segregation ATPase FtsK/SpoIIIE, S-DNA-T family
VWPLAKKGTADFFAPIPFGVDQRGRPVYLVLFENNTLVGALPGAGKTGALRVVILAAGLDPTVRVWVFENAGKGDLAAAEHFAERYVSGIGDDAIAATLQALRDLKQEFLDRSAAMSRIPQDQRPDGKLTRELANRRDDRFRPIVAVFDECQNLFTHPQFGKEAGQLAEFLIRVGRALGIHLLFATQRPDKNSMPTGVSSLASLRFCLRVMGQVENDMILGTSAYQNGIRSTLFTTEDKGMGYLVGAAEVPQIVKTYYLDLKEADTIARRARLARQDAGTLSGHAIGDTSATETTRDSLLDDLAAVWPHGEDAMWSETLVQRLAELRPDTYAPWLAAGENESGAAARQLSAALKPYGITPRQVGRRVNGGKVVNQRGIDHTALTAAIAERNRKYGSSGQD